VTQPTPAYVILTRVHVAQFDNDLQETVPGWSIRARWSSTGTVLPVFVPDSVYTPQTVDAKIRAAGKLDDEIHRLGR
jgi:hypothetical protein